MSKADIFSARLKRLNVASIRLVTGEEIIARVKDVNETHFNIDQPRVLIAQLQRKQDGTPFFAAQILNWFNADPEAAVDMSFDDIISVCKPDDGIEKEYIRFTTSIELAS